MRSVRLVVELTVEEQEHGNAHKVIDKMIDYDILQNKIEECARGRETPVRVLHAFVDYEGANKQAAALQAKLDGVRKLMEQWEKDAAAPDLDMPAAARDTLDYCVCELFAVLKGTP